MWSRATAEARAGFASICDIWSFPMVARSNCRPTAQSEHARAGNRRAAGTARENNHGQGTVGARRRYLDAAGWRAPQPPTPHPSGERPWLFSAGVFFFWFCARVPQTRSSRAKVRRCAKLRWGMELAARLAIACLAHYPFVGWRRRRVGGPSPFGTKPGASPFPFRQTCPTTRLSRCTISVRPPKPRIERMSVEERPLIRPASSAS